MTETNLSSVVDQLRDEEARLSTRQGELKAELATVEADLKRVQAALAALGEKRTTKASGKRAVTKKDVVLAVSEVLKDQGVVEKEALRTVVEAKLSEAGKSRQGFALRFEEALKDSQFVDSPSGYRLAEEGESKRQIEAPEISSPVGSS